MASTPVDKITPNDPRIQWKVAELNGKSYEFILAEPQSPAINTIFLLHGFPDLAYGWRYQIPALLSLGFRVVAPNLMGYAGTDAPDSLEFYTVKRSCADMATLAAQLDLSSIIVGAHDWGGFLAYRFALRYPKLISALFVICTPFAPPRSEYIPMSILPNFKYQIQFAGPDLQVAIQGEEKLKQFFSCMYGGRTPDGSFAFDTTRGVYLECLDSVGPPALLTSDELAFYVKSYARTGMRGPLNWYRTGELNFEDDKELKLDPEEKSKPIIDIPTLLVTCTEDIALSPSLSEGMDVWFKSLTRAEVVSGHWALVQKSSEVNKHIEEFLSGTSKASL
ncbi:hypothetical protein K3495_g9041 [Podosphaera aphanis]|nr:hypothetical protein K3495_g9041 [Podosphaera aphanis]